LINPANAWTCTTTSNQGRNMINGSFSGQLDIIGQDNTEITNRVDQLEREVKGRDTEIRELTDRVMKMFLIKNFSIKIFYLFSFVILNH
jgi:hypothetical protein